MKRFLTIFLMAAIGTSFAAAEQISEAQASLVAAKYLPATGVQKSLRRVSVRTATSDSQKNNAPYYVFNAGDDEGFVIVSGDDDLTELVAYSNTGSFGETALPSNLQAWLDDYARYVRGVQADVYEPLKVIRAADYGEGVEPLLTTKWNQSAPYNLLCPEGTMTGCVATAFAQVMNYYKWPEQGRGEHSYTSASNRFQIDADFNHAYDWDNMLDIYRNGTENMPSNYTEEQGNAVAQLMFDCGASVDMDYAETSGATDCDIPFAAAQYFGYNGHYYPRDAYSTEEFFAIIKNELDNGRPVLHGGSGVAGGHEYVIDGYDSQGFVSVNWGWSGLSDGYYNMNYMNPSILGIGGGGGGFMYLQSIVTLEPDREGTGSRGQQYIYLLPSGLVFMKEGSISAYVSEISKGDDMAVSLLYLMTMSVMYEYEGELCLGIYPEGKTEPVALSEETVDVLLDPNSASVGLDMNRKTITLNREFLDLPDGNYTIRALTRETGYDEWVRLATHKRIDITVEGDNVIVSDPELELTLSEPVSMNSVRYELRDKAAYTFTVYNPNYIEAQGSMLCQVREVSTNRVVEQFYTPEMIVYDGASYEFSDTLEINPSRYREGEQYAFAITDFMSSAEQLFSIAADVEPYYFTVYNPAGIGNVEAGDFRIYPNPATDYVQIDCTEAVAGVCLYAADGRLVAEGGKDCRQLDVSRCLAGIYVLAVKTSDGRILRSTVAISR